MGTQLARGASKGFLSPLIFLSFSNLYIACSYICVSQSSSANPRILRALRRGSGTSWRSDIRFGTCRPRTRYTHCPWAFPDVRSRARLLGDTPIDINILQDELRPLIDPDRAGVSPTSLPSCTGSLEALSCHNQSMVLLAGRPKIRLPSNCTTTDYRPILSPFSFSCENPCNSKAQWGREHASGARIGNRELREHVVDGKS